MYAKKVLFAASSLLMSFLLMSVLALPAMTETIGGDVYLGGADVSVSNGSSRNAYIAGFSTTLDGDIAGDAHAAGFDVDVEGSAGGDLYAVGASVSVDGEVGRDLTASGFTVRVRDGAKVAGNARISGASVRVSAPIDGSLVVAAGRLEIDAAIGGDVRIAAGEIIFGDDAKIAGSLSYSAPSRLVIPASVIEPEKVTFTQITRPEAFRDLGKEFAEGWSPWPSFLAILSAFVMTIVFLVLTGAILLAVMPATVEAARERMSGRPGMSLLAGFFGLAMLIGLVPVSGMTIIGIPFIPIALLLIAAAWIVSYLLGVYAISVRRGRRVRQRTGDQSIAPDHSRGRLVAFAILNFIPFSGWLINFAVVLAGLGAIAILIAGKMSGGRGEADTGAQATAAEG